MTRQRTEEQNWIGVRKFGVDEFDWPAQSPDLSMIENLWDELKWRLRARPSHPTSVCDFTNVLQHTPKPCGKHFPEEFKLL